MTLFGSLAKVSHHDEVKDEKILEKGVLRLVSKSTTKSEAQHLAHNFHQDFHTQFHIWSSNHINEKALHSSDVEKGKSALPGFEFAQSHVNKLTTTTSPEVMISTVGLLLGAMLGSIEYSCSINREINLRALGIYRNVIGRIKQAHMDLVSEAVKEALVSMSKRHRLSAEVKHSLTKLEVLASGAKVYWS